MCYGLFVGHSLSDGSPPFFLSYDQSTSNLVIDWVCLLFVCLFVCLSVYLLLLLSSHWYHQTQDYEISLLTTLLT